MENNKNQKYSFENFPEERMKSFSIVSISLASISLFCATPDFRRAASRNLRSPKLLRKRTMPSKRPADSLTSVTAAVRKSSRLSKLSSITQTRGINADIDQNAPKIKTETTFKLEQIKPNIKREPGSDHGKQTPSENTFYANLGSNVFSPVSPEDIAPKQPPKWDQIYNKIVEMRALITTPVDNFGCERMPDSLTPGLSITDPKSYRFQLLISLMLSSQTKDEVNFSAMKMLQDHFTQKGFRGICLDAVLNSTEAEIDQCISKVGFHRRKAMYIKKTCEMLRTHFGDDIPKTIEELVTFPGVGPKMGHLILQNGWRINSGIGVDVHIHRLGQMWGWVPSSDKPELTRSALESWLPKKYWADINPLLVGFGQTVCAPKANNCDVCFLADGLCKGVNRKLAHSKLTDARRIKLGKSRGNLSKLVEAKLAREELLR